MTRFARERRCYYVEEPFYDAADNAYLDSRTTDGLTVVTPHLRRDTNPAAANAIQRYLLDTLLRRERVENFVLWYYTPMALPFTRHLKPVAVVFDCMDELSAFAHAPRELMALEDELLQRADVVFTGGHSLYDAKRERHPNVHVFPSSVDLAHFGRAREGQAEPHDQIGIPRPRIGFFGVIDERMDLPLLAGVAAARPDWHIVLVGPVVKIDPAQLPTAPNIHYLGQRSYEELPAYIAGWDVAIIPFARNAATRYISPTKTLEYMAAGKPIVSTSIHDVVRPFGEFGLVQIADDVEAFVAACDDARQDAAQARLARTDAFVRHTSWDRTWREMRALLDRPTTAKTFVPAARITARSLADAI
jgi:UDP-galactopyranose mutase